MEMEMDSERQGHPWPQDMERRRIAALHKFQRNNPNYKFMSEQLHGTLPIHTQGRKCGPSSVDPPSSSEARRGRPQNENRWCLATTLELLEEMKAFVSANKLRCIGEDMQKWQQIAIHLKNPRGLELKKLARSSMVRFDNLRRYYRAGQVARIEVEVQDSLLDYFKICERQQTVGSKKTSSKAPTTMQLALSNRRAPSSYRRPSSDLLRTPEVEKFHRRQTAMYSREPLHQSDDYPVPLADDSSDSSDDDAVGLRPAFGDVRRASKKVETMMRMRPPAAAESESSDEDKSYYVHPTSKKVETQMRMRPLAAAENECSDQEDEDKPYYAASRVARHRLTVRLPKTPYPLMEGNLSRTHHVMKGNMSRNMIRSINYLR